MENSGKILLEENDSPRWYVALGSRWIGPMTASDIYEKILNHQLSWAHYVWCKGQTEWRRICEIKTFQAAVPNQPDKAIQKAVKEAIRPARSGSSTIRPSERASARATSAQEARKAGPPAAPNKASQEVRIWYLYYNDSQFGPFSQEEIRRFIKIGKIHGRVHGWREGMGNWDRLERVETFRDLFQTRERAAGQRVPSPQEQRNAPRRPLVAKIMMSDQQSVIVGICRDISVGGLQVLTEQVPAKVGAKLRMNISPSTNESGKPIEPFVAEGVIVRILEDGRGFSFRFEHLSNAARQAIESYIESAI